MHPAKRYLSFALASAAFFCGGSAHAVRVWEEAPPGAPVAGAPPATTAPATGTPPTNNLPPVAIAPSPAPPPSSAAPESGSSAAPTTESSIAPATAPAAPAPTPHPASPSIGERVAGVFTGSAASPDLRPSDTLPPLAAGGHVGASRYAEGASERWLDVGFFTQPRLSVMSGYNFNGSSNFSSPPGVSVRRTRVIIHGQAHPLLQIRLEFNISDRIQLLDAYALVPIRRWFQIQVGQFRVPFSRQELVSSARLQFAESQLWSGSANSSGIPFIPSFDLGLMAWGWLGPRDLIEYYVGIFNGEGPNQLQNLDGYFLYAGRVVVNPIGRPRSFQESSVNLRQNAISIGLNAARQTRQIGVATVGGMQVPNRVTATALGADVAVFTTFGASLYGEVYFRSTDETDYQAAPSTQSLGWLVQAGYFIPAPFLRDHLEVVGRIQDFDPSTCLTQPAVAMAQSAMDCGIRGIASATPEIYRDFQHTTAFTFGLNWYQMGHGFKIQTSYTINNENKDIFGMPRGSGIVDNDVFLLQITGSF